MEQIHYGIERFGRLKIALLHRPDQSISKITEENRKFFLFDKVPNVDKYLEEHQQYCNLLKSQGVEVHQLSDHIHRNCNLILMRMLH